MARVLGIGGVFFRSGDPAALATWYQRWLGVPISFPHGAAFTPDTMPPGGATVWSPFPRADRGARSGAPRIPAPERA